MKWIENIESIKSTLEKLVVTDGSCREIGHDTGFDLWKRFVVGVRENRKTIYFIGNGASASMASHFAADMAKNARVHTQVFSDLALITAIANDMGYENVFSEPLKRRMDSQDMLVAISSSGNSPNIVSAVNAALSLEGTVITLSAMRPDNPLRRQGKLNFYVPADTYGLAETCHAAILHHWMDLVSAIP